MPLYTFECSHCAFVFEELTSPENKSVVCPSCSKMATRANLFEEPAKPVIKGSSMDGTGRAYIQDGDYMIGHNAMKAHEKMDERNNLKRKIMYENNTTSLQRYEVEEVEKTHTGKERTTIHTEYEPLVGEELNTFIQGHKTAQKIADAGGLKSQDIGINKNMKIIDKGSNES